MKQIEWRQNQYGQWVLVDVEAWMVVERLDSLNQVQRYTRNQRNFGRRMNTTMRYW